MKRLGVLVALTLLLASPAAAHKLKVFASVQGDTVSGYAFFIGGGRPQGSSWIAKDAEGREIAAGTTDAEGQFSFQRPEEAASGLTITVDTHEAHIASSTLSADRLGSVVAGVTTEAAPDSPAHVPDEQIAALVEAAVQRQVEPVLERIEEMDSRLRFTDALSGVFFILGLAGVTLWARNRRS